ncbi:MAG: HesA/MoeB/ThiF family protein [Dehalococcoidales bacterium]|nr:HesA/MoeB/ThiF family protein [Dehalococcoidales bacterium]
MLTDYEKAKYNRQIMIPGFGEEGQKKLKRACVFLAGAGGLGSAVATYLVAAGIGTLRIADHDIIEPSNLNRQVLHWDKDVGQKKVDSASRKLRQLNEAVTIEPIAETIASDNVSRMVAGCDIIVDAMDNLPTRYILNKAALEKDIPFVYGAVYGFEGRVMTIIPGKTACLNCLYHGAVPPRGVFPVIGVVPALIGCIQATEVIKYIVSLGELLTNRLLVYDGLSMKFTELHADRDPNCEHCHQVERSGN